MDWSPEIDLLSLEDNQLECDRVEVVLTTPERVLLIVEAGVRLTSLLVDSTCDKLLLAQKTQV